MGASVNNCKQISDNFQKIRTDLKIESENDNPFDTESKVTTVMQNIANAGCGMLCEEVMIDLKVCNFYFKIHQMRFFVFFYFVIFCRCVLMRNK